MTPHEIKRTSVLALAAFFWGSPSASLRAQTPAVTTKTLIVQSVDDTVDPKVSVISLPVRPGLTAGPHQHAGPVFAYILQGDIENQVDPNPSKIYHPGDFFFEPTMHVHRMLRNLSNTESAQVLVFQVGDTGKPSPAVKTLMQEPLTGITNQEARMLTVAMAPGAVVPEHKHPGPVFAYILQGEVENQVDPDQPKVYRAGDLFYEPPMQVHRLLRNPSKTDSAELLIFQVGEKGQPPAMGVK
jgi:quercetin dioxygenase-like cupin family protein